MVCRNIEAKQLGDLLLFREFAMGERFVARKIRHISVLGGDLAPNTKRGLDPCDLLVPQSVVH
jgi:hypothetical protein